MLRKVYFFLLICLTTLSLEALDISGMVYYERIQVHNEKGNSYLDDSNITKERAKEVLVEGIDSRGDPVAFTFTDENGSYRLHNINASTNIKIRVSAKMFKSNRWDLKVIDKSNENALYVIEGSEHNTGSTDSIRDLTAPLLNQSSAPFAILDSIYQAMAKVSKVDPNIAFPSLKIDWSVNNINTGTYYDGEDTIVLQGDQKGDSDEFDGHIVIHEWGHFFENKFSRADNIGGAHGTTEYLDIRVAFGEGFGNALSAIVTDNPIYFDTFEKSGWNMNIEDEAHQVSGWFSEGSVQRILYDLYDNNREDHDRLSLGFKPIYETLIGGHKETPAFTSIFSFIDALKQANPSATEEIDAITANENIASIEESYGIDRLSTLPEDILPLYQTLAVGYPINNLCLNMNYGIYNKLGNHKYIRFSIKEERDYPIVIQQSNGEKLDPDFILFKTNPFEEILTKNSGLAGVEEDTLLLSRGEYLLDISDSSYRKNLCFKLSVGETVEDYEDNGSSGEKRHSSVGFGLPKNIFLAIIFLLIIIFMPIFFIRKESKL